MTGLDHGKRCEKHIGEVFPPRCYDCVASPETYVSPAAQVSPDATPDR